MTFWTRLLIYSGLVLWELIIVFAAVLVVMKIYDRRKEKDEDDYD